MCGIAGFFSPDQRFSRTDLEGMTSCLSHRGPDASGIFFSETVGLGHRRLSIIDLDERSNQPMKSASGRYLISYNGEVYNFREIAASLHMKCRTTSDTEVLLEAFESYGESLPSQLNGMFATAIYDQEEQSMFLFRDRLGVKPLFYYYDGKQFAFASEIKSLLKVPFISSQKKICEESIRSFLHLGFIPEPASIYQNIFKFPSGHSMKVDRNGIRLNCYWSAEEKIKHESLSDENEAKTRLKALLQSSVRYRMISDVPFGTFLSGGIDSSLITAIAQEQSSKAVQTFSIGFKESRYDESMHAQKIADLLHTDHHCFMVSSKDALDYMLDFPEYYDEPFADTSAIPSMMVSRMAREYVKMTLSGDGGDELFMGYNSARWADRLDHPIIPLLKGPISALLNLGNSKYKRVSGMIKELPDHHKESHIFSQEEYFFSEKEISKLLIRPVEDNAIASMKDSFPRKLSASEKQGLFELKYYLKDDLLVKVDRASMKYGLETRVPILDYRLVEFALNLSPALKYKDGESKYLLRRVLDDYVPSDYFKRPKQGFAIPLKEWMRKELRFMIEDYLSEKTIRTYNMVNYEEVKTLLKLYDNHPEKYSFLYNRVWLLVVLHKFLSKHF
jgi:asparagine synthase (glutamine-hydrolysing)